MNKVNTVLAQIPTETKTAPPVTGCIDFTKQTSAPAIWIHVYNAAVAALGEKYAEL